MSDKLDLLIDRLFDGDTEKETGMLHSSLGILRWTGWKASVGTLGYVGQWLLYPPNDYARQSEGPFYYSAVPPGGIGEYKQGDCFDIEPRERSNPIGLTTPKDVVDDEIRRGLVALLEHVLKNRPPWFSTDF